MPPFYYFTRATLATTLIEKGINVVKVPNIYNPTRPAWKVDFSSSMFEAIKEYYTSINKPIPKVITDMESNI